MEIKQSGYMLMTNCERYLRESHGTFLFTTDPFEAKFINTIGEALDLTEKAFEKWGIELILLPSVRFIGSTKK